jgi:hypothetical protein
VYFNLQGNERIASLTCVDGFVRQVKRPEGCLYGKSGEQRWVYCLPTNDPTRPYSAILTMNYRPGSLRIMRDRLTNKMIYNGGMLFEFFRKIKTL